jgi:hypothetical protein
VCPSPQTLDLAQFEGEACRIRSRIVEPLLPRVAGCLGALNDTLVPSARAVRPLAAGEPTATRHRLLLHRRGLSVLRRPAHCRFGPEEGSKLARGQTPGSLKQSLGTKDKQPEVSFSHATHMRLAGPAEYRSAGLLRPCRHRLRPCRWRWRALATASPNAKYRRARLCRHRRGLTLPSRGHTTAGHDCLLRPHRRRRRVPLTSNVRPHERERLQAVNLVALSNAQARAGRPSAGGRRTPEVAAEARCQHSRGLSVARAASAPPVRLGRKVPLRVLRRRIVVEAKPGK